MKNNEKYYYQITEIITSAVLCIFKVHWLEEMYL